jgi:hypothetical protein
MPKSRWLQRSVAVIIMSGQLVSCTGWRVESLSPAAVIDERHPGEIRVQRADGGAEVLYRPEVNGDSLLGRRNWDTNQPDRAMALTDVKGLATRHARVGRTVALVAGISAVVAVLIGLGSMQGPLDNWGQ